eukprot:4480941-Heterocapsa_arctica.AAC.1
MMNGTMEDREKAASTPAAGPAQGQEAMPKAAPKTPQPQPAQGTPPAGAGSGAMAGWDGRC